MAEHTNEDWRARLIAGAERDGATRARLAQSAAPFDGYHPELEAVHGENVELLARVFDAIGWPGPGPLGGEGAAAAFFILQQAISRPVVQRRGLALMLDAIPLGQANALDAAYLADRIAVFEGRGQTFGTQFDWDEAGLLSPAPIATPEHVDERRESVGLPPLHEVIAQMRANAAADGETAPADLGERRAAFDVWARRVGWRG